MWGSLENLCMTAFKILKEPTKQNQQLSNLIIRHSRLVFATLFLAFNPHKDIGMLIEKGILLEKEKVWLLSVSPGTRPLMVVSWMTQYFEDIEKKLGKHISDIDRNFILSQLIGVK